MSQLLRGAACAAVTIAVISATSARAQAFPNINKAKEAATRSVEATNRHTAAETADQSPQPIRQPAPQPAATTLAAASNSASRLMRQEWPAATPRSSTTR